jgi:hypothetical protein
MMRAYLVTVALCALAFSLASASDPSPLQDFCVALKDSSDSAGTHKTLPFLFFFFILRIYTNETINGRIIISCIEVLSILVKCS